MMLRVRHDKGNPYFILNRAFADDSRLSYKAVGIMTYLLSKPDNWAVQEEDLIKRHTDGSTSVRSGLVELRKFGYMVLRYKRDEAGRLCGREIDVLEVSQSSAESDVADGDEEQDLDSSELWFPETRETGFPKRGEPTFRETPPIVSTKSLVSTENKMSRLRVGTQLSSSSSLPPHNHEDNDTTNSGRNSGFLPDKEESNPPSNFDMRCAIELNAAVVKNLKSDRKNELRKWAHQFRLLRIKDCAEKELIKKVLMWYVNSDWSEEFAVQAYSGESFREKFSIKLIPAMKRSGCYDVYDKPEVEVPLREATAEEHARFRKMCEDSDSYQDQV